MTIALACTITRAGLAALINATNNGVTATLSHMAIGHGTAPSSQLVVGVGYTPDGTETTLRNEFDRKAIGNGTRLGNNSFVLEVMFDSSLTEGWIAEIGIFLTDGTLFAVWSDAIPISYKSTGVGTALAVTVVFEGIPRDSVTVSAAAPNLQLTFISSHARLAAEDIRVKRRIIQSDVERQISVITQSW